MARAGRAGSKLPASKAAARRGGPHSKRLLKALAPSEVEREIAATDQEMDELVYRLYGITDEERKIIEGEAAFAPA